MDTLDDKINMMLDLLERKKTLLVQIYNITDNQASILASDHTSSETNMFFNAMSSEKQKIVEDVIALDDAFQSAFNECKTVFEEHAKRYKPHISRLQVLIKEILDIDGDIRRVEGSNRMIAERRLPATKNNTKSNVLKISRSELLKEYARNSKQQYE